MMASWHNTDDKIGIYPTDVHRDAGKAKLGVAAAAEALGVKIDCRLSSVWFVYVPKEDRATFLEFAKEEANAL
ncbi:MAG: hypothetical protein ACYS7Y_11945 [Planctomycetota bacterium]|jgi:hypothetical protein